MKGWADVSVTAVADKTGDLTQLFPNDCPAGSVATTMGSLRRQPCEGVLTHIQIETDGADGGEIEIWDINGADIGANVNTATAITNAQKNSLVALGRANIIWSQKFAANQGSTKAIAQGMPFVHGLAARFISAAGTCTLNITADGGYRLVQITG